MPLHVVLHADSYPFCTFLGSFKILPSLIYSTRSFSTGTTPLYFFYFGIHEVLCSSFYHKNKVTFFISYIPTENESNRQN